MAPHSHQDAHAHVETGAFPAEGQVAMQLTLPLGNVLTLIGKAKHTVHTPLMSCICTNVNSAGKQDHTQ